ncbi:MAG: hypothetical protein L3J53_00570 [Proteobacteria bacterium]|nr:hypothetical protein [Pseudomonadota bacterium]
MLAIEISKMSVVQRLQIMDEVFIMPKSIHHELLKISKQRKQILSFTLEQKLDYAKLMVKEDC